VETSTDGLITWRTRAGATRKIETDPDVGTTNLYVTNIAPDDSYVVKHFEGGRVKSVTRRDANDSQVGQTSYTYYAQGRMETITTWQNYQSDSAVTTWTYESDTGRLGSKD
jgi:hypothetical protein